MHKMRSFFKNDYFLSVFTKLSTIIIGFISSAFFTRYLGVANKGDYSYITQIANLAVLVFNMGVYQSYSYNYKIYGKKNLKKYTDICFFQFLILIAASIVLLMTLQDRLLCFAVVLVPFNILKIQYENIVLIENLKLRMRLHIFNSIMLMICHIVLYFFFETSILYLVILTVAVDILTILFYIIRLKCFPKIWEVDYKFLVSILQFGFIPMLSGVLSTINYSIDIIFLKHIGAPDELSYYALAANIINYVWTIPDAFKEVLFSKSAKKFDKESILFSSQVSCLFITACFIGFAMLGKFAISIVYGAEFASSYGITLLLFLGAFAMSFYKILGIVLISQGKRYVHFLSLLLSATLNVVMNVLMIPVFGMYGAGFASIISYTACAVVIVVYFTKTYDIPFIQLVIPSRQSIQKLTNMIVKKEK